MQVTVTIATQSGRFAAGTVGGDWHIQLSKPSDPPGTITVEYAGPSPSANFDLTEGEVYNARGFRADASGNVLGPVVSDQFTAGADVVTLSVAESISADTPMVAPRSK